MFLNFLSNLFMSSNNISNYYKNILHKINCIGENLKKSSDNDLKSKSIMLKKSIKEYDDLDLFLPEAYALVREVSFRTLGMRHYDVQILGGIFLHYGKVTEIATGEGKTLVATLPAYLNSLYKKGVHIVTVNDYLAERDSNWMKPIYNFLGLDVGVILNGMDSSKKKLSYSKDIIYGTNNEFGFDYLRDNMVFSNDDKVQNHLCYAILDEVDSILIDEARTPLVISYSNDNNVELFLTIDKLVKTLSCYDDFSKLGDYLIDEKNKHVHLTDFGFCKIEKLLISNHILDNSMNLYDPNNIWLLHLVYSSLKARFLFKIDVDYIVKDDKVLIIDEHTGRIMDGRRWSDGIHQAIEAKEKVPIQSENQILASITFQNFFRLYSKISGMTGTAYTESSEFKDIYNLDVVIIPSNKPNIRIDNKDLIFLTKEIKFKYVLKDIFERYCIKQPVLVGTISIRDSEYLSDILKKKTIFHSVLNAKYHDKEAKIISNAGKLGSVTIATNMAGRGTDIVLGGGNLDDYKKIVNLGGLRVIGTERHESRRIDNQLRGRSARQGDPGSSQFYLSLEDDLIRVFISDKITFLLNKLSFNENDAISHHLIDKAIENAQRKVEGYNFDARKQLLEFDNVFNEQRKVMYDYRNYIISIDDISFLTLDILKEVICKLIDSNYVESSNNDDNHLNIDNLISLLHFEFNFKLERADIINVNDYIKIKYFIIDKLLFFYKENIFSAILNFNSFEKILFLNILDTKWREHLSNLEYIKKSIYLRSYAQKDPLQEYKRESFLLFTDVLDSIKYEFISLLFKFPFKDISSNKTRIKSNYKKLDFKYYDTSNFKS